ncbi:MAG: acetyl-CoA carboxylase carboxyltransferase subunit alpha [bacterium]|nr:acetyl-CoA carboxylase carboxyltransferase subunit alpha [bacterium]
MSSIPLAFENEIYILEKKLFELKKPDSGAKSLSEAKELEKKLEQIKGKVYASLTPWQRVQLARHPQRPYTLDYVKLIFDDFVELRGDRLFSEDQAIVAGLAKIDNKTIMLIGHQKGRGTKDNLVRNFGMPHPEGYRKARRLMKLAEKFGFPVVTLIDTPGAYPGIGAEERGQGEAIANNMEVMIGLQVPVICVVIGEGSSGGALAIGVGDKILMMENAIYSVISPEGCAAILWKDSSKVEDAAEALKLTAPDLLNFGIIDEIIPEPIGGAHRFKEDAARNLKNAILNNIKILQDIPVSRMLEIRFEKFKKMGRFIE